MKPYVKRERDGKAHIPDPAHGHPRQKETAEHEHVQEHAPQDPYVRPEGKVGRNDPCPCGSGLKFKKCCGAAA